MENIFLEATKYTPEISLDAATGIISLKGKSYPENTFDFYEPVVGWLKSFFAEAKSGAKVVFDISYFNSSSSKLFFDIFDILEEAVDNGSTLSIEWMYDAENDSAKEAGEDFKDDFETLEFELIEK